MPASEPWNSTVRKHLARPGRRAAVSPTGHRGSEPREATCPALGALVARLFPAVARAGGRLEPRECARGHVRRGGGGHGRTGGPGGRVPLDRAAVLYGLGAPDDCAGHWGVRALASAASAEVD